MLIEELEFCDDKLARRFANHVYQNHKFIPSRGQWIVKDGSKWCIDIGERHIVTCGFMTPGPQVPAPMP